MNDRFASRKWVIAFRLVPAASATAADSSELQRVLAVREPVNRTAAATQRSTTSVSRGWFRRQRRQMR
jgi:hypothetical protein